MRRFYDWITKGNQVLLFLVLLLVVLLASCAATPSATENLSVTTYYDRNEDGVVDYELHRIPGMTYWTWALMDSKFKGRYDARLRLAYPFGSDGVDLPVPRNVKITPGMPPIQYSRIEPISQ